MILGADGRSPVPSPASALPTSAVAQLIVSWSTGITTAATGVLVGPNDVLTGGHVLYDLAQGGMASAVTVFVARDGLEQPFGAAQAKSITVHPGFVANPDAFNVPDLGLVTLDREIGSTAVILAPFPSPAVGTAVTAYGYPGDKPFGTMWRTEGTVDSAVGFIVKFTDDFDTAPGQSGSPLLANGQVVGVHSYGLTGENGSVRLDHALIADVDHWSATNNQTTAADLIVGGAWGEAWSGLSGNDTIAALDGDDTVNGDAGGDDVNGNRGRDLVNGGDGADFVRGGQGDDTVFGEDGDDWHVNGNIGADLVYGGNGNDAVFGGPDGDRLFGDAGDDALSGDLGNDTLSGGPGADVFVLRPSVGRDVVLDYELGVDRVQIATAFGVSAAQAAGMVAAGPSGAVLALGDVELTLIGISVGQIGAADFVVV